MAVRTAPTSSAAPRRHRTRAPRRPGLPALLAVASLVALPLLVYGVPALAGHVVVPGDDLTQSLPLRQLVGKDILAGHLPVFDPYLWSGTPLLGGWNAGAAYPLTWLFAVLPATAAWTVTLASAVIAAGVGCYAFLRANGLRVVASWLGAVTFAFGGGMSAQLPHIGLVVGVAWIPLGLLAILRLTGRAGQVRSEPADLGGRAGPAGRIGSAAGWTAVLAVSVGLVVLAGEPRAIADAATVLLLYGAWRLGRLAWASLRGDGPDGHVTWAVAGVAAGAALGVGLGAVQLLPGLAAVATSQRAAVTFFLFSAGSLPVPWLLLLGVPDLLGGSGAFGQPTFFASYSLTEVTGYVGMLPLVAAGALLGRVRLRGALPEWAIWYVIAVAGAFLALGAHTPLWHLLIRIPLFGGQRLQSRSILITGLALAVLLAYWADGWVAGPGSRDRRQRWLGAVLPAGVVAVVAVALIWRVPLLEWMGVAPAVAARAGAIGPWLIPFLVLAAAAIGLVWAGGRSGRRTRPWRGGRGDRRGDGTATGLRIRAAVLVAFVVVDLAVFAVTAVLAVGTSAPSVSPASAAGAAKAAGRPVRTAADGSADGTVRPIATLHLGGRFAVYDPTVRYPGQLSALGVTDANVVTGTYSVEGYGSIVDGRYARATGTHGVSGTGQDVFAPQAADNGVLDALDTTTVLVPGDYLVSPAGAGTSATDRTDGRIAASARPATWELGTPLSVAGVTVQTRPGVTVPTATLTGTSAAPLVAAGVRIGLVVAGGQVEWSSEMARSGGGTDWFATWPAPVRAVAVEVATTSRTTLEAPVVTTAGGTRLRPSGALDATLVPPHWTYAGRDGAFAVYRNHRARQPLTLQALPDGSLAGATVARTGGPALDPRSARVSSPDGVAVVRAMAAIPGWSATWTPAGDGGRGRTVHLAVRRDGVVQLVRVPPGRGTLTWHYHAPGLLVGAAASCAASLVVAALAVVALVSSRYRRRRRDPKPAVPYGPATP